MEDIARLAGVSRATVSRALADNPRISTETRQRVAEIARANGYVVNDLGRRLREGTANTISVVIPLAHDPAQPLSDPFFSTMLSLLADDLSDHGYDMLLTKAPALQMNWIQRIAPPMRADGVIVIGQSQESARLEEAVEANIPLVVWGNVGREARPRYACVGSDNRAGGELATRHLLSLNRSRIAFMGDIRLPEVSERHAGYLHALAVAGITADPSLHLPCAFDGMDASLANRRLLASQMPFDAIFAASDLLAIAAIAAMREAGLSTPRDVAVVGFDDVGMASYSSPALTTIRQDFKEASRLMVRRVIDQIGGAKITNDVLPVQLIVRQSA